ncbi:MAG: hypothetical protein HUK03_06600, partial [Bacteroidaceae bacterium]|nr:hypothetical protein [Bacteroidaceae bacterium]
QCADATQRAVYAIALGKLYGERSWRAQQYDRATPSHPDSLQEWTQMDYYRAAARNFGEAFAAADLLHAAPAKAWVPLTLMGTHRSMTTMLDVAWRSMTEALDPTLRVRFQMPDYAWMVAYYERKGSRGAALQMMLDSLESAPYPAGYLRGRMSYTTYRREALEQLRATYADEPLCAEVYLRLSQLPDLTVEERRRYLLEGVERYSAYERVNALHNALTELEEPLMEWTGQQTIYPARQYDWKLRVRNVQQMTWTLYRLPDKLREKTDLKVIQREGTKVQTDTHDFTAHAPYDFFGDTLRWTAPATSGHYALVVVPRVKAKVRQAPVPQVVLMTVTRKKTITQTLPDGSVRCEAVDAVSGAPLGCDCEPDDLPKYRRYSTSGRDTETHSEMRVFTDRAIYRPGQTVHVAVLAYDRRVWNYATQERVVTLKFNDPNRKTLLTRQLTTDAYGVAHTELTLPADKVGSYQIVCGSTRAVVRVEEYKRPTFEVTFDPVPEVHYPTDSITLTGVARRYNGTPVREA